MGVRESWAAGSRGFMCCLGYDLWLVMHMCFGLYDYGYRRHLVEYRRIDYFAGPLFLFFPVIWVWLSAFHGTWLNHAQYSGGGITSGSIEISAMEARRIICPTKLKPAVIAW